MEVKLVRYLKSVKKRRGQALAILAIVLLLIILIATAIPEVKDTILEILEAIFQ